MTIIICATFLQHHQQQNHLSSSSSISSSHRFYDGNSNLRARNSNNGYGANGYNVVVQGNNARNRGRPGAHKSSLSIGTQGQGMETEKNKFNILFIMEIKIRKN